MANFAHVERITAFVGNKGEITFRSKFEYRWCVWCELRKEQGIIQDWWYEDEDSWLELTQEYKKNKKIYRPDFTILYPNGDYELEETKGYFPPKDYTTLKLVSEQYEIPLTLVFAGLISYSKNPKSRAQYVRAKRIEEHIKRVIYDANETIFKKISHLFEY